MFNCCRWNRAGHAALIAVLATCGVGCQGKPAPVAPAPPGPAAGVAPTKAEGPDRRTPELAASAPATTVVKADPGPPGWVNFTDVTADSGISFVHTDGGGGTRFIVQTVVAGLATFDYDGDGLMDIYLLNSAPNPGATFATPPRNALYRNNGDWTYTDVTEEAGVGDTGYGLGVTAGDFDADGDLDLYVNNFGPNVFYQNNGDGTFTDITEASQTGCDLCGAGVAFFDADGDGLLDLYVANYVDFAYDRNITESIGDRVYSAGPASYRPLPDRLFRNLGDATFADISEASGIAAHPGPSMGIVCADLDDDGDTDVFVAGDNAPNQLFRNDGQGRFTEVAFQAGVAFDLQGKSNGSMGVVCGDYNGDGRLDLFVTTFSGELAVLYRNDGGGFFTDVSRPSLAGASTFPHVKWGTTLSDFDHDGDLDLFIACGHFWRDARYVDSRTDTKVPNAMLENLGNGTFRDRSSESGTGMGIVASSKGAVFDDLDNDGDLDAVILNANDPPTLLRNDLQSAPKSVQIALRAAGTNREAVGARVTLHTDQGRQIAEVHRGSGYQSHGGNRLHFGLGKSEKVRQIEVRWPAGGVKTYEGLPDAPHLLVDEDRGVISATLQ
jgi:hypothetical protein